jgi:hypothetical protein
MFINVVEFPAIKIRRRRRVREVVRPAWRRVHPLFADASPTPRFYEVIVSSERETPGIAP